MLSYFDNSFLSGRRHHLQLDLLDLLRDRFESFRQRGARRAECGDIHVSLVQVHSSTGTGKVSVSFKQGGGDTYFCRRLN